MLWIRYPKRILLVVVIKRPFHVHTVSCERNGSSRLLLPNRSLTPVLVYIAAWS